MLNEANKALMNARVDKNVTILASAQKNIHIKKDNSRPRLEYITFK